MNIFIKRNIIFSLLTFFLVFSAPDRLKAQEKEDTYSISLVKTAETEKEVYEVDQKKVLAETHVVKKGEHIWQMLRERGLLRKRNLSQILSALKSLNKSLDNLDLIQPGQQIIIPLKIAPLAGEAFAEETYATPEDLKDLNLENYMVKPGDNLVKVIKGMYEIPDQELYNEYLEMVKRLNPSIDRLDYIYPRQVIRLPIYSPEKIRIPIKKAASQQTRTEPEIKTEEQEKTKDTLGHDLGVIFTKLGEEWIRSGDHFIPLKSGGQMDLKAETFPIINLRNGLRVIVDLENKLPDNMTKLIESSWQNYRVVHLTTNDLETSLDKVFEVCGYPRVLKKGQPLELEGEIPLEITGDWIVTLSEIRPADRPGIAVIKLNRQDGANDIPWMIKDYLADLGIEVIDYPVLESDAPRDMALPQALEGRDPTALITNILSLSGRDFTTKVDIPVYQSQKADLKLVIKADFFFRNWGKDAIIDLTGLGPEVIALLEGHSFQVLTLTGVKDSREMVAKTLDFLSMPFEKGPQSFVAGSAGNSGGVLLKLPGILFSDIDGQQVLATPLILPDEIALFLHQKGYNILVLSPS